MAELHARHGVKFVLNHARDPGHELALHAHERQTQVEPAGNELIGIIHRRKAASSGEDGRTGKVRKQLRDRMRVDMGRGSESDSQLLLGSAGGIVSRRVTVHIARVAPRFSESKECRKLRLHSACDSRIQCEDANPPHMRRIVPFVAVEFRPIVGSGSFPE